MLSARNIEDGRINFNVEHRLISKLDFERENDRTQIIDGDVLLTIVGALGRSCVVASSVPPFTLQRSVAVLRPTSGVDSRFLALQLRAPLAQAFIDENAKGTAQRGLYLRKLSAMPMRVPPIREQRRVVDKVEALFAHSKKAKASLDRIPGLLDKLKRSILAAAFRGDLTKDWREAHPDVEPADQLLDRIRAERRRRWEEAELARMRAKGKEPSDARWKQRYSAPRASSLDAAGAMPRSWTWCRLEEVAFDLQSGVTARADNVATSCPVLRSSAVRSGRVDIDDVRYLAEAEAASAYGDLSDGDVLVTRLSGSLEYVANCGIVRGLGEGRLKFPDRLFRVQVVPGLVPEVLELALDCSGLRTELEAAAKSTAGHQRISMSDLRAFSFPLAPEAEQREIVVRAKQALAAIGRLRIQSDRRRRLLNHVENGVLAKAFRGELVPQDPDDEPASVLLERIRAEREASASKKKVRRGGTRSPKTHDEPEPAAPPTRSNAPAPAQAELPFDQDFLDLDPRDQARAAATALFGAGALPEGDALRLAADGLRELGLSAHKRLRVGGKLHAALEAAVARAAQDGLLDRPADGEVRAVKADPKAWSDADWSVVAAAVPANGDVDAWVREAAAWAAEHCGLEFGRLRAGGLIDRGLRAAHERARA